MKMINKIATLIVVGVLSLAGIILFGYNEFVTKDELQEKPVAYEIVTKWQLPKELDEISGIDWIGSNKLACIQDEDGIIYIFNLNTSKVEMRINFASAGDYEDIRIVGNTAYIVRSDGEIFEVNNYLSKNLQTNTYSNFLTEDHNLESLVWNKGENILLLAIKDREPENEIYKGIYKFSLSSKKLHKEPTYQLNMKDSLLKDRKTKLRKKLQPSALGLHPLNNEYYILDGRAPQLIITDSTMQFKKRFSLQKADFRQAEGLTFSSKGRMFISNEGKDGTANILEVVLKNN